MGGTVSETANKTIHIQWVRSGIGFSRSQKNMVRSLGLSRLNQVVARPDTPQIRGLVESIPHLVKIVSASGKPSWMSVAEYTILPPLPQEAPQPKAKKEPAKEEEPVAVAAGTEERTEKKKTKAEPEKAAAKSTAKAKKPAKTLFGKAKAVKAGDAKKSKGAGKGSKPAKKTKK